MTEMDEHWVSLDALPNYAVSNFGRVINVIRGNELSPSPDKNGYLRVALYHNGKRYDVFVHRLVALCFFLNYKDGIEVKHINGNKEDNGVLNLTLGGNCRVGKGVRGEGRDVE